MPEFNPGELKTAVVAMSNPKPKAFDYVAELYMGTNLALMAQAPFRLEAEESKDISLPVAMPSAPGVYPVFISVTSESKEIGTFRATEDVTITPAIALRFKNPRLADTVCWDARLFDVATKSWSIASIRSLDTPCIFYPTSREVALVVTEWWSGTQHGPFVLLLPSTSGEFTWDNTAQKLDGVTPVDVLKTSNRCLATVTITGREQEWTTVKIEDAEGVPGYFNAGVYFIGTEVNVYGQIPRNFLGESVIQVGRRATVWIRIGGYPPDQPKTYRWYAVSEYRYVREFPDSYYSFSGGVYPIECLNYYIEGGCSRGLIGYQVSGVAPNFKWRLYYWAAYHTSEWEAGGIGPVSSQVEVKGGAELWAHPDPDAPWFSPSPNGPYPDDYVRRIHNWVKMGSVSVRNMK